MHWHFTCPSVFKEREIRRGSCGEIHKPKEVNQSAFKPCKTKKKMNKID